MENKKETGRKCYFLHLQRPSVVTPYSLHALGLLAGEVRVGHFGLETCPPPRQRIRIETWPKLGMVTLKLTEQAESKMWLGKISCMCTRGGGRWPSEGGCPVRCCPSHWWHSPGPHHVSGLDKPRTSIWAGNRAKISDASFGVKNKPKAKNARPWSSTLRGTMLTSEVNVIFGVTWLGAYDHELYYNFNTVLL